MKEQIKLNKLYSDNFDYFVATHGFVMDLVQYCHSYNISDSTREKDPKDGTRSIPNCFQYVDRGSYHINAHSFAKYWADKGVIWGKDIDEFENI